MGRCSCEPSLSQTHVQVPNFALCRCEGVEELLLEGALLVFGRGHGFLDGRDFGHQGARAGFILFRLGLADQLGGFVAARLRGLKARQQCAQIRVALEDFGALRREPTALQAVVKGSRIVVGSANTRSAP